MTANKSLNTLPSDYKWMQDLGHAAQLVHYCLDGAFGHLIEDLTSKPSIFIRIPSQPLRSNERTMLAEQGVTPTTSFRSSLLASYEMLRNYREQVVASSNTKVEA